MKFVKAFFAFWYDFIVGDAWEVAAGVLVVLLLLFIGGRVINGGVGTIGVIFLPLAIVGLLMFSLWRVRNTV
jgi:hypothetical protein